MASGKFLSLVPRDGEGLPSMTRPQQHHAASRPPRRGPLSRHPRTAGSVALRWDGWRGFDEGGFLVATVAAYNDPEGVARVPGAVGSYWLAFVRQERSEM